MDNVQLSKANEVYISQQAQNKNTTTPIQPQVQQVEDGENKMNKVLLGLGILGAAAIGITCAIKGKQVKKQPKTDDVQKLVKEFGDINFNKGTAKLKDGTLFTGTVEKVSKNGDKLSMEYVDGILKKSTNKVNGTETIKEYTNGIVAKKNGQDINIKKVQDEVKSQQEKLKKLLADDKLTSQDFKTQADEIKFKSKNQEAEIKNAFDKKVEAENTAKIEAERLAKEAEEKAKKEQQEIAQKIEKEAQEKNTRIATIKKQIDEEREKFFKENKDKLPPLKERYKVVKKYCRTSYGNTWANETRAMEALAENDRRYLKFIWQKSDTAKDLYLKLALEEMSTEQLDTYTKAVSTLEKKGLSFDKYELTKLCRYNNEVANTIAQGRFTTSWGEVAGHGMAYSINGALRAGYEVDDILRVALDEGFKEVVPLEHQERVYRHVTGGSEDGSINFINQLINGKKGDSFSDKGYSYSTFKKGCAVSCNGIRDINSPEITLEIIVPKGAKVSDGRSFEQCEMLFPRNAEFRIIEEATQTSDNAYKMMLEYILP